MDSHFYVAKENRVMSWTGLFLIHLSHLQAAVLTFLFHLPLKSLHVKKLKPRGSGWELSLPFPFCIFNPTSKSFTQTSFLSVLFHFFTVSCFISPFSSTAVLKRPELSHIAEKMFLERKKS